MKTEITEEFYQKVTKNVQKLMQENNVTNKDVAAAIDMDLNCYAHKIRLLSSKFNIYDLKKLADYFGVTIDSLVFE